MKTIDEIEKYDTFIYNDYNISYLDNKLEMQFFYEIKGLKKFIHKLEIPYSNKNINKEYVANLVFNIGLMELINYYKATVAKKIVIKCGKITDEQIDFFKKIYFHGLGEFFYTNGLNPDFDTFLDITCEGEYYKPIKGYHGSGALIAIGGGKDSCVTLSLVGKTNNNCFIINPKKVMLNCAYEAGFKDDDIISVRRILDKGILELNDEGYLNGHIPFSAMVAFVSFLTAYLNGKEKIILSNESSANEANVAGTKINHQYSKSYEFEKDFQNYAKKFLGENIKYYSLLRPLSEYQIGMIFARLEKFHPIFKSCNVGSKNDPWCWCGHCAKCLFVFSLLSPHLYKDKLVNIFGYDLFAQEELLTTFEELLGFVNVKPFDCVGTFQEINYAITKTIKNLGNQQLPILLQYYKDKYYDELLLELNLEYTYNNENSLDEEDEKLIKEAIFDDKKDC